MFFLKSSETGVELPVGYWGGWLAEGSRATVGSPACSVLAGSVTLCSSLLLSLMSLRQESKIPMTQDGAWVQGVIFAEGLGWSLAH